MRPLFETAHLLNRHGFAWDDKVSHPLGKGATGLWTETLATHVVGAVVLLLGPSGKIGLAFVHELRDGRAADQQPKSVIAVGSSASRAFSKGIVLFDHVFLYEDAGNPKTMEEQLGLRRDTKVLVVKFGARGDVDVDWVAGSKRVSDRVLTVIVGGGTEAQGEAKACDVGE